MTNEIGGVKGKVLSLSFGADWFCTCAKLPRIKSPFVDELLIQSIHDTVCSHSASDESAKLKNSCKL